MKIINLRINYFSLYKNILFRGSKLRNVLIVRDLNNLYKIISLNLSAIDIKKY